jgi:hypothetical protein
LKRLGMVREAHVIHSSNCIFGIYVAFKVNKANTTTSQTMRVNQNSAFINLAMTSHQCFQLFLCVREWEVTNVNVLVIRRNFMAERTRKASFLVATFLALYDRST